MRSLAVGTAFARWSSLAVLVVMTGVGVPLLVLDLIRGSNTWWFDLLWLTLLAVFWYEALVRAAYKIDVVNASSITFRSVLRRVDTSAAGIRAIRSKQGGVVTVETDGGKVTLFGSIDGWVDFVQMVRAANPDVRLKGI